MSMELLLSTKGNPQPLLHIRLPRLHSVRRLAPSVEPLLLTLISPHLDRLRVRVFLWRVMLVRLIIDFQVCHCHSRLVGRTPPLDQLEQCVIPTVSHKSSHC